VTARDIGMPELLTADEVAAWLKTTRKAVYAKAERGTLAGATYVGRRLYFLRADLRAAHREHEFDETLVRSIPSPTRSIGYGPVTSRRIDSNDEPSRDALYATSVTPLIALLNLGQPVGSDERLSPLVPVSRPEPKGSRKIRLPRETRRLLASIASPDAVIPRSRGR
jgi:hypothetical protein